MAAAILLATAVGCSRGGNTPSGSSGEGPTSTPETSDGSAVPAHDYGGYGFIFADAEATGAKSHFFAEISADASDTDTIPASVYKRNEKLVSKYNIKLKSNFEINLYGSLNAGEDIIDAVIYDPYALKGVMQDGLLVDLNTLDHFSFDSDWWMKGIAESVSIKGKLYMMTGSANIRTLGSTQALFFNKTVAEDRIPGTDIYKLVDDGEWTLDKMLELAASAGADNGDGVWDEKDSYGLAFNNFSLISFFFSSGCRFITKDDNGELNYDFGSDRQIDVLTKTVDFLNDQTMTLYGERYADKYQENGRVYVLTDAFKENRALFINNLVSNGILLRNMETEYGVVPQPKYDTAQKDYITFLHGNASYFAVPLTASDKDCSARIIEDMAYYSQDTVRSAYIDIVVKQKYAVDGEDSARMLDIVYGNVIFDMGYFAIGSIDGTLRKMADNNNTGFSSMFATNINQWERLLNNYFRPYLED